MHKSNDDERKQRLSVLCKKLRGNDSLRSFTKKRSQELSGIGFTTWGAWERGQADLSKESLEKLVKFISCSYQAFAGYLDGFISLEELFQPSSKDIEASEEVEFSPEVATAWVQSLNLKDKLYIASQSLNAFEEEIDRLVKSRTRERTELLLELLSGSSYPEESQIEVAAQKLDISVENLRGLCDRVYLK